MFNAKEFYSNDNEKIIERYKRHIEDIKTILKQTEDYMKFEEESEFYKFINQVAKLIITFYELEQKLCDEYFENNSIEQLMDENNKLFDELLQENYQHSYANPEYTVKIFGDKIGQLISTLYLGLFDYIEYSFKHQIYKMCDYNEIFIDIFVMLKENDFNYEKVRKLLVQNKTKNIERDVKDYFEESYNKEFEYYTEIINNSELSDLRYLFKFGEYVSNNEIKTSQFLNNYSQEKIDKLGSSIVQAYVNGFTATNKDIKKRSVVNIFHNIGQERITRSVIEHFKKINIECIVFEVVSTDYNKQIDYDHKFDSALYFNDEYAKLREQTFELVSNNAIYLKDYSGIMYFDRFGEAPFTPQNKKECLKLSEKQSDEYMVNRNNIRRIKEKYMPEEETSFCMVAFPTPEIGNDFETIFNEISEINMLDSSKYEKIQKNIIDVLDMADYVHVKGSGKNETDIFVKMNEIKNHDKETNFVNCVADVNVPVGEVFTSPVLKGTNGVLHLDNIFLDGLKFVNLKLTFKDGYVEEYSCSNFEDEEENKKYIEENILFPHKTLPLGEFAIGTNTLAYVMAGKYNIVDRLPVLIIEKMGPHFAIGDTCFSRSEDLPQYNMIDGKEIIARDNEKSILRKTNINEAYTNIHTDITLPYDSIGEISAVLKDGNKIEVMKNGRFVVDGTEELNLPFEN